jgi:hypothetical protein
MSNILEDQPVNGSIIVTSQGHGGTLFGDHASDGGVVSENRLVRESAAIRTKLPQFVRGRHEEVPGICQCVMPTLARGNPSRVCVTCGKTVAA